MKEEAPKNRVWRSEISAEERAEIRAAHVPHPNTHDRPDLDLPFRGTCWECNNDDRQIPYPCPTIRLLGALEAAEKELTYLHEAGRRGGIIDSMIRQKASRPPSVAPAETQKGVEP